MGQAEGKQRLREGRCQGGVNTADDPGSDQVDTEPWTDGVQPWPEVLLKGAGKYEAGDSPDVTSCCLMGDTEIGG